MNKKKNDLQGNYVAFSQKVSAEISANFVALRSEAVLVESYAMVAAVNALKVDLLKNVLSDSAFRFFAEAHNDLLLSHMNASFGSWRIALQSLRSFIENSLAAVYYNEHPVELRLWQDGKFSIAPRDLREYFAKHPDIVDLVADVNIKATLDAEYSTLSKAVHGSNDLFRMTSSKGTVALMKLNKADLGKWMSRMKAAIDVCVLAICAVFRLQLEGARLPHLREALATVLLPKSKEALKLRAGVKV